MKLNESVTLASATESLTGTVDGYELAEGGYVLHIFIADHTDGSNHV